MEIVWFFVGFFAGMFTWAKYQSDRERAAEEYCRQYFERLERD